MFEQIVPPGRYTARAIHGSIGSSPVRGTPQVIVTFEITSGPYRGRRLRWYGYLTEKARVRTLKTLVLSGCTLPTNRISFEELGSREVSIVVTHVEYDGRLSVKVEYVNALVPTRATNALSATIPAADFDQARRLATELSAEEEDGEGRAEWEAAGDRVDEDHVDEDHVDEDHVDEGDVGVA